MSCPFPVEHIQGLKQFIQLCKANPSVLQYPELSFFKTYVESLGGKIPDAPAPTPQQKAPKFSTPQEPKETPAPKDTTEEIVESDVELDMEGVVPPDEDANQVMGPDVEDVSEEAIDASNEKKREAVDLYSAGKFEEATKAYTEAILLNPGSAMLYAKRGQTFLAQKKPNACVRDCDRALELNPDSAAAYKFRGRARRLLGDFVRAAEDLRCACKLDFDEQTDEWLKEVTPNARKLEEHQRKYERLRAEQQVRLNRERAQQAKEARAKAHEEASSQAPPAPEDMGNFSSFMEMAQDPEFQNAMKDPEISNAFQDIWSNPSNILKYQNNPKITAFLTKITGKWSAMGGGGLGGLGGLFGGMPGMPTGPEARPTPGSGPAPPADIDVD